MLKIFLLLSAFLTPQAFAESHIHHPKHNMILIGESEIFASHIVYKAPHNFQVILKLELDAKTREIYLAERKAHAQEEFIFLLDELDIGQIANLPEISGTIFRRNAGGEKVILAQARLTRDEFTVLYFDELPLSLE